MLYNINALFFIEIIVFALPESKFIHMKEIF